MPTKVNYDFHSRLHELYAVRDDPLEQDDLWDRRPDLARRHRDRARAYREVRNAVRRFTIDAGRRGRRR